MDQLSQIRLEKKKEYLRQTFLPSFFDKYKVLMNPKYKKIITIQRFIKNKLLKDVVNQDNIIFIPGIFRYRVKLNDSNLNKPTTEQMLDHNYYEMATGVTFSGIVNDIEVDSAIRESLKDYDQDFEKQMSEAIEQSIINHADDDFDYEEMQLNKILMESFKEKIGNDHFYICLDLRIHGRNPEEPIYVEGIPYYLDHKQKVDITKAWNKVNPDTSSGIIFQQKINYIKSLSNDLIFDYNA